MLGWVIREGVTNVVRHSGATRVRIVVTSSSVDVTDDGASSLRRTAGTTPVNDINSGSGIAGLRERLHAAGGTLTVGPADNGGWRLHAEVPS